ncbi:MAG: 1,3-beta-galactosyl-N-acetylhexosamine phosphorylase N-terminal domain-containing protein [Opitutaceae bacterium]
MPHDLTQGAFTLPGEAGFEDLTLRLAKKWGADNIRDSDGTQLSPEILRAGYNIYSTVCLVRSVNEWAKQNRDKVQQNFLMSFPVVAEKTTISIDLLAGFFKEQFVVNFDAGPKRWWQVFDRTTGEEVPKRDWSFNAKKGAVTIRNAAKWHKIYSDWAGYAMTVSARAHAFREAIRLQAHERGLRQRRPI